MKPSIEFKSRLCNRFINYEETAESLEPLVKFKLNVLVESDVLINFLFDYSQDSSKSDLSKRLLLQSLIVLNKIRQN